MVTRDELMAMGCAEISSQKGRKAYVIEGEFVALQCMVCESIKEKKFFYKQINGFGETLSRCKVCKNAYVKSYAEKHAEKIAEYRAGYNKKYAVKNREIILDKRRDWRKKNRVELSAKSSVYYSENRTRILERTKEYFKANPHMKVRETQMRRARKYLLPNDLTVEQLTEINAFFHSTCALSGESTDIQDDHVIPISIGHGGSTYGNMIPLSAELNRTKSAQHLYEWFDANKSRFNLDQSRFNALIEYLASANEMTPDEYRKYTDFCFDNPRVIDEATGELVFISQDATTTGSITSECPPV